MEAVSWFSEWLQPGGAGVEDNTASAADIASLGAIGVQNCVHEDGGKYAILEETTGQVS